jgi:hypothetical protein
MAQKTRRVFGHEANHYLRIIDEETKARPDTLE